MHPAKFPLRRVAAMAVAALAAVASAPMPAAAADAVLNLVGTWKMTGEDHAASRVGNGNGHFDPMTVPTFEAPDERWTFVFEVQRGRSFYGSATGPSGKTTSFVGVFRRDGRSFIISNPSGIVLGEVVGEEIEVCFADNLPDWMAVNCAMMARQGS